MRKTLLTNIGETCRMIKIEHSVFALPFALAAAFLAASGVPSFKLILLIILEMIFARSSAMAFNRYLDAELDGDNPRTSSRSIPSGRLSKRFALLFAVANSLLFIGGAYLINDLAFYCAPGVLLILFGYSYTKRFTSYCHFILGIALGLSPLGAWIAVRGEFALLPVLLGLAVMFWTAGFDLIYSCQDVEFDRGHGLLSIPVRIGVAKSLYLSRVLHTGMISLLVYIGFVESLGYIYWLGLFAVGLCIAYEHFLVWGERLENANAAFFTMNGAISLLFGATTIASVLVH